MLSASFGELPSSNSYHGCSTEHTRSALIYWSLARVWRWEWTKKTSAAYQQIFLVCHNFCKIPAYNSYQFEQSDRQAFFSWNIRSAQEIGDHQCNSHLSQSVSLHTRCLRGCWGVAFFWTIAMKNLSSGRFRFRIPPSNYKVQGMLPRHWQKNFLKIRNHHLRLTVRPKSGVVFIFPISVR